MKAHPTITADIVVFMTLAGSVSLADHTPDPDTVTLVGSLQNLIPGAESCGMWNPACPMTYLAYDGEDDVWQGSFDIPAGSYEYKVALDDSWDESYGQNAGGTNILLAAPGGSVKFYYDHKSHWITDPVNHAIAVVAGSFQSEIGCAGDWNPGCLRSWLQDPDGDGIYSFSTDDIPAGSYTAKVAHNESWDEQYGVDGQPNGSNILFQVPPSALMTFDYDLTSHILTISSSDTLCGLAIAINGSAADPSTGNTTWGTHAPLGNLDNGLPHTLCGASTYDDNAFVGQGFNVVVTSGATQPPPNHNFAGFFEFDYSSFDPSFYQNHLIDIDGLNSSGVDLIDNVTLIGVGLVINDGHIISWSGSGAELDPATGNPIVRIEWTQVYDCNANGIPDNTEPDCNTNGIPDDCDITPPPYNCCETGHGTGCNDPDIEACVCAEDPFCCDSEWDDICVENVVSLGCGRCNSEDCNNNDIPDECDLQPPSHNCCETGHGPGCSDPVIEPCICGTDPFCCELEWDSICVANVESLGCGTCATDCNNNGVPDECDLEAPPHNCCGIGHGPGCSDLTITACVCAADPFCCDTDWDFTCVQEMQSLGCGWCNNDCNDNNVPDDCDPDADSDGVPDNCDACAGGVASGDTNANGFVELGDYAELSICLLGPTGGLPGGCECFDFDSDDHTTIRDVAAFQNLFNSP
ncbi:MAG: pullulanase X25 domain-containing protein [Planctomycetota bacterium]